MSYIGPFVPLAAQAAQWVWTRYTRRVEQADKIMSFQPPTAPATPKPPTLDEVRARYAPPQPIHAPKPPQLRDIMPQMPGEAQKRPTERFGPQNDQYIVQGKTEAPEGSYEGRFFGGGSYADEFDTSVACLPCTRGHLSAMSVAAGAAARAAEDGDIDTARRNLARLAAEAIVMERFDWTPEKLGRASPEDRMIIERVAPQVRSLLSETPTAPVELVGAWSAVDESLRFARSPEPSEKDLREIHVRLLEAENLANYAERHVMSPVNLDRLDPEQRQAARDALNRLRHARHALTAAETVDLATLEAVAAEMEQVTVLLTPTPDPERAKEIAERAREIRRSLDEAVRAKMRAQAAGARDAAAG